MNNPSNDISPNFQFTAPSMSKPAPDTGAFGTIQGLSRPRIARVRKSQHNRTMGGAAARKFDTAVNRFQHVSDDCGRVSTADLDSGVSSSCESGFRMTDDGSSMIGVNRMSSGLNPNRGGKTESSILDEIKKLGLGDEKASMGANGCGKSINERESGRFTNAQKGPQVDESSSRQLHDEIKRLNIQDSTQRETSLSSEGNHFNLNGDSQTNIGFGAGDIDDGYSRLLTNDLKKLNIKDPGVANGNGLAFDTSRNYNFEFGNRQKESDFVVSSMADTITNKMKNLDVKADRDNVKEKVMFDSGNSVILDELAKLKIGDELKGSYNHSGLGKSSSQTGVLPEKMDEKFTPEDKKFHGEGFIGVEEQVPRYRANDGTQTKQQFIYTSKQDSLGTPELNAPSPKGTSFFGFHQKLEFGARREPVKDSLTWKMKVKLDEPTRAQPWAANNFFSKESCFSNKQEPSESYSPMEVSPYQEPVRGNQSSREASITSEESVHLDENHVSNDCQQAQPAYGDISDEDLISAKKLLGINEGKNMKFGERTEQISACCVNEGVGVEASSEESVSAVKTECFKSANDFSVMSGENEFSSKWNDQAQSSGDGRTQFFSASSSELRGGVPFKFSASSSVEVQVAPAIRSQKKKNRTKVVQDPYNYLQNTLLSNASSTIHLSSFSRGLAVLDTGIQQNEDIHSHHCKERPSLEVDKRRHVKQEIASPSATAFAAKEACEKWRLRGNQAYSSGNLDTAEDCYTQGVNSISKSEASRGELRALMLCYSNRAAVRMSLGRFRDALTDCRTAAEIDANFFRVLVRKANCYIALGEVAEASPLLMKFLQSGTEDCADRKLIVEASESFQKAQKVSQCIDYSAELLRHKTLKDAELSLQAIDEALAISPYSEKLLQMKAEALFLMQMHQEVIQLCEQTLQTAEKNFPLLGVYKESSNLDPSELLNNYSFRIWRYSFIFNSYFYLGKLEEGLEFLEKQTDLKSATDRYGPQVVESLIPLLVPAQELVKRKSAGNAAYQAGKHAEAIEHYTVALACNAQSRPFAAVCFGNRAAAYQSLGQISDAIADCNLAIALDRNYIKAISRRATLFEMIRDYDEAASDLRRVISLLTKQAEEKANQPEATDKPVNSQADLRQAYMWLSLVEELAIKEPPLDFYLILGVEPSATSADLKKAYRKAALRHHPDKACQLLTRGETVDDWLWKEMSEEVQREADRLFKMIGEAYSTLSDPTKRFRYEEEVRNALKKSSGIGASRMRSEHSYGYQRSSSTGRSWREAWATPGSPHSRHFEPSRSSRFF